MSIQIVAVTRSNKGKGVTVTLKHQLKDQAGEHIEEQIIRKTGGEKYGKIALWFYEGDLFDITIHKPMTTLKSDDRRTLAQVFEF